MSNMFSFPIIWSLFEASVGMLLTLSFQYLYFRPHEESRYGRFGHLSTKISKRYYSLKSYVFLNL